MEYATLILLHILGATIWTGGHLVLAIAILPKALRERETVFLKSFEQRYERIGIPAFILQLLTGLRLAYLFQPDLTGWWGFHDRVSAHLTLKFILLGLTLLLAIHARTRLVPHLSIDNLASLAVHIIAITVVAVLFVIVGVSIRVGGLF